MNGAQVLLVLVGAFAATVVLTRIALGVLRSRAILDQPNDRSSHQQPTPRGGGIAVISVVAMAWLVIGSGPGGAMAYAGIVALAVGLAAVSWLDDLRGLGVRLRFAIQALAVLAGLLLWPGFAEPFMAGTIGPLAFVIAALAWLWFVNLYNFMDGIDGMAGSETAAIGVGLLLLAALGQIAGADGLRGAALLGAGLGFLVWNWHPAKVFLGDVGSIPLGFLIGWLLLHAASQGAVVPALILPLYYLADATVTLLLRLARGQRFWEAHRDHFYQRALAPDGAHDRVVVKVTALNVVLIALACVAEGNGLITLLAALAATAALLVYFARRGRSLA